MESQKVLFCNTNFIRDLKACAPIETDDFEEEHADLESQRKYEKIIKDIVESDVVLIPYYPERQVPKRKGAMGMTPSPDAEETPMLVELKPDQYAATLYMKSGDRITMTTMGGGDTPNPTETTGK